MGLGMGLGMGVGRGGRWTPAVLGGLTIWLPSWGPYWQNTPGTTPATAAANPVREWDDAKLPATDAIAPSDPARPPLAVTGSLLVPQFDGAAHRLVVTAANIPQPFWAFAAANPSTVTPVRSVMDSQGRCLFGVNPGPTYRFYAGTTVITGGVAATGNQVLACRFDGANSKLYKNGGAAIAAGNPGAAGTGTFITVGSADSAAEFWQGFIHEFFIVAGAMANAEVDAAGRYLAAKLGLTWSPIA